MQYGYDHQLKPSYIYGCGTWRTPARTLVMSKILMPANGRVGETAGAAVARPRHILHIGPLNPPWGRIDLVKPIRAFKLAMPMFSILLPVIRSCQLKNEGCKLETRRPRHASVQWDGSIPPCYHHSPANNLL